MPLDPDDGAEDFAAAGPQALVHHLDRILGAMQIWVIWWPKPRYPDLPLLGTMDYSVAWLAHNDNPEYGLSVGIFV